MTQILPPFIYYGGKTTLAERIVAALPRHQHYVEPFAGSLAVLLAKPPAPVETVNDLDGDLMTFWRVLREQPEELARVCALTPHSRSEFEASKFRPDDLNDVERARRVWVNLTQGRSGILRKTGWRYVQDPRLGASMPDYLRAYAARLAPVAARLSAVSLECLPALDLIERYGRHHEVCLYVDPPYLGTTRGWGNSYAVEMRSEADHIALAESLNRCAASVVLSGYASPLYADLYAGWRRVDIPTTTGNGGEDRARIECLWINRPDDSGLFALLGEGAVDQ